MADQLTDTQSTARRWKDEIELVDKSQRDWVKRCEKIIKRYRDERDSSQENNRRFNVLWSNVQTLLPSVYGRQPVPIAERRFLDRDPIGRLASIILERVMRYNMEDSKFHPSTRQSVLDYLLTARGTLWWRYEPTIGAVDDGSGDTPEDAQDDSIDDPAAEGDQAPDNQDETDQSAAPQGGPEKLLSEKVCADYVNWKDFLTFPAKARTWEEVEAVARRTYQGRDELIENFGKKKGRLIPLDHKPEGEKVSQELSKATIYEIWDKSSGNVIFIAQEYDDVLKQEPDPLHLENFWPCPMPLFGISRSGP